MAKELVSIITPSYNSERFIEETIKSVLNQTYDHWEMIIVDDRSQDRSLEIIRHYQAQDSRIKLIRSPQNQGPAAARNLGIELAAGRYISFLDSDDLWLPQKLEKQVDFMKKNAISLSYASYYVINERSEDVSIFHIPKQKVNYQALLKTCVIGNLTAMYDSFTLGKVYMEDVGHEDYTLWLKILKKIDYAYGIPQPLAKYRVLNKSISSNKLVSASWQWNIYRNVEHLSLIKSLYYFLHYAWNGIRKY